MSKKITPTWKLSITEAKKSVRDWVLFWVSTLAIQLLEIAQVTDFWEYQILATILLWAIAPIINRYANLWRI